MATQLMNLPLLSFTMTVGTNEDWLDSLGAYLDAGGNPISLADLVLNFEMRPTAASASAAVVASTGPAVAGLPTNALVLVGGAALNIPALDVPRTVMMGVAPGTYVAEMQAEGDGLTRTIGLYTVTVVQGIVR